MTDFVRASFRASIRRACRGNAPKDGTGHETFCGVVAAAGVPVSRRHRHETYRHSHGSVGLHTKLP
jgi:hypothetical protein